MSIQANNGGDGRVAIPGTSNQTGNRAPKFDWEHLPEGRFGRIFIHCVGNHLGFTDDFMAKNHKFPSQSDFGYFFNKMIPWFAIRYNQVRREKGYTGSLQSFNGGDAENRLRYEFAKPGQRGNDPKARLYGVSSENYLSTKNQSTGGRMEVWVRCSEEIFKRLKICTPITYEEAMEWGR